MSEEAELPLGRYFGSTENDTRIYSLEVEQLLLESVNDTTLPEISQPPNVLYNITLNKTAGENPEIIQCIVLGRLICDGKPTYWIVRVDCAGQFYAFHANGVSFYNRSYCDEESHSDYIDMIGDEDEHVCSFQFPEENNPDVFPNSVDWHAVELFTLSEYLDALNPEKRLVGAKHDMMEMDLMVSDPKPIRILHRLSEMAVGSKGVGLSNK